MICICYQRQLELLSRFSNLPSNVGAGLVVPPGLVPAAETLGSAQSNASAALAAAPAGGVESAAESKAAAATELAANPELAAAAELSALASSASAMNSSLGVDVSSPSAGEACQEVWNMLPALIETIAGLPLYLQPKLSELAKVGELVDTLKNEHGADLESPGWADTLGDSVASKLADATDKAQSALDEAGAAGGDASQALASETTAELAQSSSEEVVASTMASVQTGMGVDLAAPGAMDALGTKLGAMKGTLGSMPSAMEPIAEDKLLAAMQMLASIDSLRHTLGVDVLAPGAGGTLQAKVNSLDKNLAGSDAAAGALNEAASAASSLGAGGSSSQAATAEGKASLASESSATFEGKGGAALEGSAEGAAAGGSAAALAGSPLANPALAALMAGMPGVPVPWLLLTAFCAQVKSTLGIQLIAHGPCE